MTGDEEGVYLARIGLAEPEQVLALLCPNPRCTHVIYRADTGNLITLSWHELTESIRAHVEVCPEGATIKESELPPVARWFD